MENTAEELRNWLTSHGLDKLAAGLTAEDVDLEVIATLEESDLKEIGISLGNRKRLLLAIETLSAPADIEPTGSSDSDINKDKPASSHKETRSAERRQLTVMFCDVAGSTALSETLDPEDLRNLMLAYQEVCFDAIHKFGGHLAKYLGDGVLAYFGYPTAHEDDPSRSVSAGLALLTSVRELNVRLRKEMGLEIGVRIGIHTGLVVAGEMGAGDAKETDAIVGETPNIAARLEGLASSGGMVIGPVTRRLIGDVFECTFLGKKSVKGISNPIPVYSVEGERSVGEILLHAASKPYKQLIGREAETRQLLDMWRSVCRGNKQLVFISGEAGVGKTRLIRELARQVSTGTNSALFLQGSPVHNDIPLYPLKVFIQSISGFDQHAHSVDRLDALKNWLLDHALSVEELMPALLDLLSLPINHSYSMLTGSPQLRKRVIAASLMQVMAATAGSNPLLLLVEDAHWIDPTTLDWIEQFLRAENSNGKLVLVTSRPEYSNPWEGKNDVTGLVLNRLGKRAVIEVIATVFKGKGLPSSVISQLLDKADGIPLFAEELSKSVLESGALIEREREYVLSGKVDLAIPSTLQDLLTARLDHMGPGKEVAQIGSAIGRQFARTMIAALSTFGQIPLAEAFTRLLASNLVERESSAQDEILLFRHALMRDAAYHSMLKSRRQKLHHQIADMLVADYQEKSQFEPAVIADHLQRAGRFADAINYWKQAAQSALDNGANLEAVTQLQQALNCVESLPDSTDTKKQELDLQCMIGPALMATKGWAAAEPHLAFQRAKILCEEVGDKQQSFAALWGIWLFYAAGSDLEIGLNLVDELFLIAEEENDEALELQAHHAAWGSRCWFGDMEVATKHVERGLELYNREQHNGHAAQYGGHDPGVCAQAQGALTVWYRGFPDLALQRAKRGIQFAHELNHPPSIAHAQLWLCNLLFQRRERNELEEAASTLSVLAQEHGLGQYLAQAALFTTWATIPRIGAEVAIQAYQDEFTRTRGLGHKILDMFRYVMWAEATLTAGHLKEAADHVNNAFELIEAPEPHVMTSDLFRLKSAIEFAKPDGDKDAACDFLHQAISISRKQNARSIELRAGIDLARHYLREGDVTAARELLFPIQDWFTEGFETVDWKAADALRAEIIASDPVSAARN